MKCTLCGGDIMGSVPCVEVKLYMKCALCGGDIVT